MVHTSNGKHSHAENRPVNRLQHKWHASTHRQQEDARNFIVSIFRCTPIFMYVSGFDRKLPRVFIHLPRMRVYQVYQPPSIKCFSFFSEDEQNDRLPRRKRRCFNIHNARLGSEANGHSCHLHRELQSAEQFLSKRLTLGVSYTLFSHSLSYNRQRIFLHLWIPSKFVRCGWQISVKIYYHRSLFSESHCMMHTGTCISMQANVDFNIANILI